MVDDLKNEPSGEESSLVEDLRKGHMMNEESPFVIKPKFDEKQEELFEAFLKFSPDAGHAMSLARMPVEISAAYVMMQSDLEYAMQGGVNPRQDAASMMAAYHARDGHPFDTAASIARGYAAIGGLGDERRGGLMGLLGRNRNPNRAGES